MSGFFLLMVLGLEVLDDYFYRVESGVVHGVDAGKLGFFEVERNDGVEVFVF